jgi:D-beta-D-heptose 7-phosphate kinase/D-beta-D-heptose 1-phosphate adenosyltransferase
LIDNLDFSGLRVLVVGDAMLDLYYTGHVERISPEAPVPVVSAQHVREVAGGAANLAMNVLALGGDCSLLGFLGPDENTGKLARLLAQANVENACITTRVPCVAKLRVVAGHQQIVRVDFDSHPDDFNEADYDALKDQIRKLVPKHDLVILSDYAKGVCRADVCATVFEIAGKIPVLVDPKGAHWEKYQGATLVKPNLKELSTIAGANVGSSDSEVEIAARQILRRFGLKSLLVTRSEKGMSLVSLGESFHLPTDAREVFDVSGAGDTVLAAYGLTLAKGEPPQIAMRVANVAAGIVIGKMGTATVTRYELEEKLFKGSEPQKVLKVSELVERLAAHRQQNNTVVFTNGCFDILHRGHLEYLRQARLLGSILVVGLNSDASTQRLKGPGRPVNRQEDRAMMLAVLPFVDYVVIFNEDTPYELLKAVRPDILVKGGDYKAEEIIGREFAGKTLVLTFVDGYSTTRIIDAIKGSVQ